MRLESSGRFIICGVALASCQWLSSVDEYQVDNTTTPSMGAGGNQIADASAGFEANVAGTPSSGADSGANATANTETDASTIRAKDGGAGSPSDAGNGPRAACETAKRCIPLAPDDWEGPAARFTAAGVADPPSCPESLGRTLVAGHLDLASPAAECTCACGAPIGASCSRTSAADFSESSCITALGGGAVNTTCSSLGGQAPGYILSVPSVDSGICQALPGESLPDAERSNARSLCVSAAATTACTDQPGACLSETTDGVYCISRPGANSCPERSVYTERELVFTGITDSRGCSQCSCGNAEGTCQGTVTLFSAGDCAGAPTVRAANDQCVAETSFDTGFLTVNTVSATCAPTTSNPLGTVLATNVVTLCCAAL